MKFTKTHNKIKINQKEKVCLVEIYQKSNIVSFVKNHFIHLKDVLENFAVEFVRKKVIKDVNLRRLNLIANVVEKKLYSLFIGNLRINFVPFNVWLIFAAKTYQEKIIHYGKVEIVAQELVHSVKESKTQLENVKNVDLNKLYRLIIKFRLNNVLSWLKTLKTFKSFAWNVMLKHTRNMRGCFLRKRKDFRSFVNGAERTFLLLNIKWDKNFVDYSAA